MMTLLAPAKLNLFLHVTGRRANGYHSLQSLVCFVDYGDQLSIEPATKDSFEITGPFAQGLPSLHDNLVMQALHLLRGSWSDVPPCRITLEKNLPIASGIGGGSADAAAAVRGVLQLAQIEAAPEFLSLLLLRLGADVPVCFTRRTSLMQGIGEQIDIWPSLPDFGVLLVNAQTPLLTKDVFAHRTTLSESQEFVPPTTKSEWLELLVRTHNDLQPAAIALLPEIQVILDELTRTDGTLCTRMSGSGATCFALYDRKQQACDAARILQASHPHWWVQAGEIYYGK